MSDKTIEQVLAEHTGAWMDTPGIVGTAIGLHKEKPCILILTSVSADQISPEIPGSVEGYPVIIENTGEFRALGPDE